MGDTSKYPGLSQLEYEKLIIQAWMKYCGIIGEIESDHDRVQRANGWPDGVIGTPRGKMEIEVTRNNSREQELSDYIAGAITKKQDKYNKNSVKYNNWILLIDASPIGSLVDIESIKSGIVTFQYSFEAVYVLINTRRTNFEDFPFHLDHIDYEWIKI